jgi:hypothetical protein
MEVLERAGLVEHSYRTAMGLQLVSWSVDRDYQGDLNRLHFFARDQHDLGRRLRELGDVVTPGVVALFLRELREVWEKATAPLTRGAVRATRNLGLVAANGPDAVLERLRDVWEEAGVKEGFRDFEAALSTLGERYCRGRKCHLCPVRELCPARA